MVGCSGGGWDRQYGAWLSAVVRLWLRAMMVHQIVGGDAGMQRRFMVVRAEGAVAVGV